ncbi:DUF2384 domain-containing protein [Sinimarinibacterium sp. CAU 1509]|uniref:MbcA/ParS/Xre antitoxin family protein n=1 Tax=Sinimarinibacterium sp. CAU 1509 TaxID=2562283 RepID=UPI0010AD8112|nr:MbcA/ParS/Xre antitoxin family protein [Sinimarinibacterium sp. CAU 1509]TJY57414.1 DUF2384 domain-containing protein [Sinimarinibacterium sp. CAU 1509]
MASPAQRGTPTGGNTALRETDVGFRAALNIASQWGLTDDQLSVLLGGVGRSTVARWKSQLAHNGAIQAAFGPDTLDRVSYLLGIFKALRILFPDKAQADAWVKKPNTGPGFDGRSALQRMLDGRMDDLRYVRVYLDGWRGW